MEKPDTTAFYRRSLPHWRVAGRAYFVTFRLKNSIPKEALAKLQLELSPEQDRASNTSALEISRARFLALESILDKSSYGEDTLCRDDIAQLIVDAFDWAETERHWRVPAYVIMPNHVHCLLVGETATCSLSELLRTIKGVTARKANQLLSRTGPFWAPESFDHWCRSSDKEERVKRYIRNNPVKAGLVKSVSEWPWVK